jgi:hypothetical protein
MNECVQSLYGIERLLEKRELGPAQILPALNAFGTDVEQSCRIVRALFGELHELSQMAATVDGGDSDVGLSQSGTERGPVRPERHELLSPRPASATSCTACSGGGGDWERPSDSISSGRRGGSEASCRRSAARSRWCWRRWRRGRRC